MARHVYVHIPFCARKCDYCDFYSVSSKEFISDYFKALRKEIEETEIISDINDDKIDTVYFGGGTPSVPDERYICDILKLIRSRFDIGEDAEITIECNPNSVSLSKFKEYGKAGFNRVSLGVQSLHEDVLKTLGRLHDPKRALEALDEAFEAGFGNVSADLMCGIPGQSLEGLLEDAKRLTDLGLAHISMYSLIIEEGTPFYSRYKYIEDIVDPELERRMYHELRDFLASKGLKPYEISNCGRPSIHNMSYWDAREYYGFGAAASGYLNGRRFSHIPDIKAYIKEPMRLDIEEVLSEEDKRKEYVMLRFRTEEGVGRDEFKRRFSKDLDELFGREFKKLGAMGLIKDDGAYLSLTYKGSDFANVVFEEFV